MKFASQPTSKSQMLKIIRIHKHVELGNVCVCYQELTKTLQQRSALRAKINSEISWEVESAVSRIKGLVTPYHYGDATQIHSVS